MSASSLLWGVLFGGIGIGYFLYGKKQHALVPFLCGIALMTYPWFVSGDWALFLTGAAITAVPVFVKL